MSLPGGIDFAWPWMLAALVLPVAIRYLLPAAADVSQSALRVPEADFFSGGADLDSTAKRWPGLRMLIAALAWTACVLAAMRPQLLGEELSAPVTGRNLMLAVDLSGSMEVRDFTLRSRSVNRLTATKAVAGEFLDRREGDRLGLILFGERAYLQAPLTFDRETVKTLLFESFIGLAGEKTAIGDAIGLAVRRIHDSETDAEKQVLILLTDGANTAGNVPPLKAAELAASIGLKIYTIGIGAERMEIPSLLGGRMRQVNPSTDLDEATLVQIAKLTDGQYFRARDTQSLTEIYATLDELEPAASDEKGLRPVTELFYWPLALSLFAALALAIPRRGGATFVPGAQPDAG